MKNLLYIFLLLNLCFAESWGQEAMSLEKAISIGLENNYGIKVSDKFIEIAENSNSWARAGRGPVVDLNTSLSNAVVKDNNDASFLQGTYYNGSIGGSVDAQWVIFNGGRIKFVKSQLERAIDQQKLNKEIGIHDLLRNIYQQYYQVLFQQEQLELLEESLTLSKDRLDFEQAKRDFGASNAYNLIQFENAVLADSTNAILQIQRIETEKRNFYNLLDLSGFQNYDFPERLNIIPEEIDEARLKEMMVEGNFTLRSLELISALNKLNTQIEESNRKPVISLAGSAGFTETAFKFYKDNPNTGEPFETQFSNRLNANVSANLNWNLYDGGVRKQNIQNARLQEEIDQLNFVEAVAEIHNQLDILIANHENQKQVVDLTDQQSQVALRNLDMTEERFRAGQVNSLDFRNVQLQYLSAALNKVNAIYNLIITQSEIDYLVGRFDDEKD